MSHSLLGSLFIISLRVLRVLIRVFDVCGFSFILIFANMLVANIK